MTKIVTERDEEKQEALALRTDLLTAYRVYEAEGRNDLCGVVLGKLAKVSAKLRFEFRACDLELSAVVEVG